MLLVNEFFGRWAGALMAFVLLSSCGTNGAPAENAGDSATNTVAVTPPTPAPTTPTSNTPTPAGLLGEVAIADNFTTTSWIEPGVPESTSPDEVGAFLVNVRHRDRHPATHFVIDAN